MILVEGDPYSLSLGKKLNRYPSSDLLQRGERCAKEHKSSIGVPVNLVQTICAICWGRFNNVEVDSIILN